MNQPYLLVMLTGKKFGGELFYERRFYGSGLASSPEGMFREPYLSCNIALLRGGDGQLRVEVVNEMNEQKVFESRV
jgi:hypothetical protein